MLTPEQKRNYLSSQGNCPFCGSGTLCGDSYDCEGGSVAQRIECEDCGKSWHDIYTLTDIEEIFEDDGQTITLEPPKPGACIQVEYDLEFAGGNYSNVGDFAYVPVELIDKCKNVEEAFQKHTGIDPIHIIHYCEDDWYTTDGELVED